MPKIEEDGKSWLRRSKVYKGVVEPYKKKKKKKKKVKVKLALEQVTNTNH